MSSSGVTRDAARPVVVVSQPMYFPWVGLLEQIRLADHFVHYPDVQFTRGFMNRVQVKTETGVRWLTVPLRGLHRGQRIDEVRIDESRDWRRSHTDLLSQALRGTPHRDDAMDLLGQVLGGTYDSLAELSTASTLALARYFGLDESRRFHASPDLGVGGSGTGRLVGLCERLGAGTYLTGHGARHYLRHEDFESSGIDVSYIQYGLSPYPQLHGPFTPYVSALDLVANMGRRGIDLIRGRALPWRDFLAASAPLE